MHCGNVKFYVILSGKGGVGKSTVSSALACHLSNEKTLLIDFDLCGPSLQKCFGVKGKLRKIGNAFTPLKISENLHLLSFGNILDEKDVLIWRGAKKRIFFEYFLNAAFLKNEENFVYKNVVIDTPPGISEEHNFLAEQKIPYNIIFVTTSQNIALSDTITAIEFAKKNNFTMVGIIQNMSYMFCECCNEKIFIYGKNGGELLANEYDLCFLGEIEMNKEMLESVEREDFMNFYKTTNIFDNVFKEV
ncbi:CFD1 [Ecytonucleospora hepatopenaei]|uniref:CFD1 n=1 Tax=Ecytonucleospora hepatopenaei TaxID=646526 RepID=A0A1W0E9D5_9MICR|nr:CFD1 [Ecytonucleospora hepatopenaei]